MKWRVTFFALATAMLLAAAIFSNVFLLLGAIAAAFFAAIKWW